MAQEGESSGARRERNIAGVARKGAGGGGVAHEGQRSGAGVARKGTEAGGVALTQVSLIH